MRKKTFALYPNGKARHQTVKLLALVIALVYVAFTALYDKNGRENDKRLFYRKTVFLPPILSMSAKAMPRFLLHRTVRVCSSTAARRKMPIISSNT